MAPLPTWMTTVSTDIVAVDNDGRLRAFANRSGAFREAPIELPYELLDGYLTRVCFGASHKTQLLASRSDRRLSLLALRNGPSSR
jgi:hypothetical protein